MNKEIKEMAEVLSTHFQSELDLSNDIYEMATSLYKVGYRKQEPIIIPTPIYIKTDMTEMPRNCKECRDKKTRIFGINNEWTIADAHCFYRETSTTGGSSRPLWCPLVEHFVDANKTIGGER